MDDLRKGAGASGAAGRRAAGAFLALMAASAPALALPLPGLAAAGLGLAEAMALGAGLLAALPLAAGIRRQWGQKAGRAALGASLALNAALALALFIEMGGYSSGPAWERENRPGMVWTRAERQADPYGIDLAQAKALWDRAQAGEKANVEFLDARSPGERVLGTAKGFVQGGWPDLAEGKLGPYKGKMWIVGCWTGMRGSEACWRLRQKGIDCRYLREGLSSWAKAGYPLELAPGGKLEELGQIQQFPNAQRQLSDAQASEALKKGAALADMRPAEEFAKGRIEGAVNLPLEYESSEQMEARLDRLGPEAVVAVCGGYASCSMAQALGWSLNKRGIPYAGAWKAPSDPASAKAALDKAAKGSAEGGAGKAWPALLREAFGRSPGAGRAAVGIAALAGLVLAMAAAWAARRALEIKGAAVRDKERLRAALGFDPEACAARAAPMALASARAGAWGLAAAAAAGAQGWALAQLAAFCSGISAWGYADLAGPAGPLLGFQAALGCAALLAGALRAKVRRGQADPAPDSAQGGGAQGQGSGGWAKARRGWERFWEEKSLMRRASRAFGQAPGLAMEPAQGGKAEAPFRKAAPAASLALAMAWPFSCLPAASMAALGLSAWGALAAARCLEWAKGLRRRKAREKWLRRGWARLGEWLPEGAALGGKAAGLAALARLNCPVPEALAMDAGRILDGTADWEGALAVWSGWDSGLAVRSSGIGEDGPEKSMAGLNKTFLLPRGAGLPEVMEKAREAAQSLGAQSGSVVVQKLVEADLSGALFTFHPFKAGRALAQWGKGLGAERMQGGAGVWEAEIERDGGKIARARKPKGESASFARGLWDLALGLESHFGEGLDIEWVMGSGRLWIVQCRPQTALGPRGLDPCAERIEQKKAWLGAEGFCGLKSCELSAYLPQPSAAAASLAQWSWSPGGPADKAAREAFWSVQFPGRGALPFYAEFGGSMREVEGGRLVAPAGLSKILARLAKPGQIAQSWEQCALSESRSRRLCAMDWAQLAPGDWLMAWEEAFEGWCEAARLAHLAQFQAWLEWDRKALERLAQEGRGPAWAPPEGERGYRAALDYEIAQPRLCELSAGVAGVLEKRLFPGAGAARPMKGTLAELAAWRERAKHAAVCAMMPLRLAYLDAGLRSGLGEAAFGLDLGELEKLARAGFVLDGPGRAGHGPVRREEGQAVQSLEDRLGAKEFWEWGRSGEGQGRQAQKPGGAGGKMLFLSAPKAFEGLALAARSQEEFAGLARRAASGEAIVALAPWAGPDWIAAPGAGSLAGVCLQTGSMLSHPAVLAREMGLPMLAGAPQALWDWEGRRVRVGKDGSWSGAA